MLARSITGKRTTAPATTSGIAIAEPNTIAATSPAVLVLRLELESADTWGAARTIPIIKTASILFFIMPPLLIIVYIQTILKSTIVLRNFIHAVTYLNVWPYEILKGSIRSAYEIAHDAQLSKSTSGSQVPDAIIPIIQNG